MHLLCIKEEEDTQVKKTKGADRYSRIILINPKQELDPNL